MADLETSLAWTATRADTIDRFNGQTPRPEDESVIIEIFEQHPQLVLNAIDETAVALAQSKITWAWSVLRTRLERGTTALREATADTSTERTRRITNAERWIRNAGLYLDQQEHLEAALFEDGFGDHGQSLRDYAHDHTLRARLVELWKQLRPIAERAEAEHETRLRSQAAIRQSIDDDIPF